MKVPIIHEFIEFFFEFRYSLCTLAGVVFNVFLHPWFLSELYNAMYICNLKKGALTFVGCLRKSTLLLKSLFECSDNSSKISIKSIKQHEIIRKNFEIYLHSKLDIFLK